MKNDVYANDNHIDIAFKLGKKCELKKVVMLDLPDNTKGYLMVIYNCNEIREDPYYPGGETEAIRIMTPIIREDGSIYDEDFLKLGTHFQFHHPYVALIRDAETLYVAFSYTEVIKKDQCITSEKLCDIKKYNIPNLDITCSRCLYNKKIENIAINDEEISMYDKETGNIIFLDKYKLSIKDKWVFGVSNDSSMNSISTVKTIVSHDITLCGENLVTTSSDVFTIYDRHLKILKQYKLNQYQRVNDYLSDFFKKGEALKCPKTDIVNNRVYFLAKRSLYYYDDNGFRYLPIYPNMIYNLEFNPGDCSLLLQIVDKNNNIRLISLTANQLEIMTNKKRIEPQRKLLP